MRGHLVLAEALAHLMGYALGHPAGVHEDQRGAVALYVLGDAVQDLRYLLGRGHGPELVVGNLQGEIEGALVPDVHDRAPGGTVGVRAFGPRPHQEPGDGLDRPLGRREPDPLGKSPHHVDQALEGQREMRPPLVPSHGMYLVDDERLDPAEHRAAALGRDQQI